MRNGCATLLAPGYICLYVYPPTPRPLLSENAKEADSARPAETAQISGLSFVIFVTLESDYTFLSFQLFRYESGVSGAALEKTEIADIFLCNEKGKAQCSGKVCISKKGLCL